MSASGPVTAVAPGGVGNVGPGLDILGLAVDGAGDTVRAEWSGEPGIRLRDAGHPSLPLDPARHTSALAGRAVLAAAGERLAGGRGIALSVTKLHQSGRVAQAERASRRARNWALAALVLRALWTLYYSFALGS